MSNSKFITVPVADGLTSTPTWYGLVQHTRALTKKETYAHLADKIGKSKAKIKSAFLGLARYVRENAAKGNSSCLDGIVTFHNVCKGAFATLSGPWVKGRNYLLVLATEQDPFKRALDGITPANVVEGAKPTITSVLDNVAEIYDVLATGHEFTVAGADLGPDPANDGEYVAVRLADGTLVKATILESTLQSVKAKFDTPLAPGDVTLVVCTRSGYGEDGSLKSATRKIKIG
ncbi:MAG: hypothetical protein MJ240_08950 [Kiritimatiellae bacterium]|nr:hypothetical protein [Kiritimatiellia bacterium]